MPAVVKLVDASRKLRLKKMQVAGTDERKYIIRSLKAHSGSLKVKLSGIE